MIAWVEQQMPMRVLFGVMGDTADHAAAPTGFGFNQHGNVLNAKLAIIIGVVDHAVEKGESVLTG
jgi:hypothetical protein